MHGYRTKLAPMRAEWILLLGHFEKSRKRESPLLNQFEVGEFIEKIDKVEISLASLEFLCT